MLASHYFGVTPNSDGWPGLSFHCFSMHVSPYVDGLRMPRSSIARFTLARPRPPRTSIGRMKDAASAPSSPLSSLTRSPESAQLLDIDNNACRPSSRGHEPAVRWRTVFSYIAFWILRTAETGCLRRTWDWDYRCDM